MENMHQPISSNIAQTSVLPIFIYFVSNLFLHLLKLLYPLGPTYSQPTFDEKQDNDIYQFNLYDKHRQKLKNYLIHSIIYFFDVRSYGFLINIDHLYNMYLLIF